MWWEYDLYIIFSNDSCTLHVIKSWPWVTCLRRRTWLLSLQLCSFFIDSVHVFNVLLLRVSVDVASSSGSRRGFILTRFQCRNYVRFFFFAAIPSLAHVLRVAGRGENVFCQGFSKEFCMFFVSGLAHVYVILSIAVESPCCCRQQARVADETYLWTRFSNEAL